MCWALASLFHWTHRMGAFSVVRAFGLVIQRGGASNICQLQRGWMLPEVHSWESTLEVCTRSTLQSSAELSSNPKNPDSHPLIVHSASCLSADKPPSFPVTRYPICIHESSWIQENGAPWCRPVSLSFGCLLSMRVPFLCLLNYPTACVAQRLQG